MQMDSQSTPTFFKVIIDASAPQLPLPPDFVTFHLKNKIPKNPIIIQSESRGYYWKLKIEEVGEFYCFTHGWNNIVKDIKLCYGDFLVFNQVDHSTFNVLIFSPNGCEKDLPSKINAEHDRISVNNDDVDDEMASDDVADPFFTSTMTKTNRTMLELPLCFLSKHLENKIICKDLTIRSANEEYSRRLKIEKIDGNYCFAHGWNNVIKDLNLGATDFLVFRLVDKSTFEMVVYNPSGVEKVLPPKLNVVDDDDDDPIFTKVISASHVNIMRLPWKFMELAGIYGERSITMKNGDGKEWKLRLRLDKTFPRNERYCLSAGWRNFRLDNNLSKGDECVFKYIKTEDILCLAKITKKTN